MRHKIVKVNYRICGGVAYYITFDARDSNTGDIRTYQSLVYRWAEREKSSVEFTRLKPESKKKVEFVVHLITFYIECLLAFSS